MGLWAGPKWVHYAIAILGVLAFFVLRLALEGQQWMKVNLIWFTFPVCISAIVGGLWPGMLATTTSFIAGYFMFVVRSDDYQDHPERIPAQVLSIAVVWLFISIVCDMLRTAVLRYRDVAIERDQVRRQFSNILGGVSDGFCAVNGEFCILLTNRAFRNIFASGRGDMEGRSLWEMIRATDTRAVKEEFDRAIATGKPVTFDHRLTEDGRWFHLRAFPNSDGLFVYIQDITSRRAVEEGKEKLLQEEKEARNEAEEANRLRDEFIATVSHELRTPLTAILGWSEILGSRAELANNPELSDGLKAIERSTRLQAQLIDDLLDMSRIANGKLRLNVEVVDIKEVADQAIQSCNTAAEQRNVQIQANYIESDVLVRGDFSRLVQIVANLVSNAVKFSSKEGNVWVQIARDEDLCTITVRDEGVGIDRENLAIIFDRFRQANATITRRHGGLGLGLSIVKQLTELHGGTVAASSQGPGLGSTFTVTLPVAPFVNASKKLVGRAPKTGGRVDDTRILVVEDDDATRKLLTVVLKDAGAHVGVARSALEGLDEVDRGDFDIILSDISMPEMDGYSMIRKLRQEGVSIPAIAISAFARPEDRDKSIEAGYDEHLSKPVDISRLISTIRALTKD